MSVIPSIRRSTLVTVPLLVSAVFLVFSVSPCLGQGFINSITGSNVDAYFGAQSDAYQQPNPVSLPSSWTAVTTGLSPYTGLTQLPGVPGPPIFYTPPSNVTQFSGPALSSFSNLGDSANSIIQTTIGSSGTVDDAQIKLIMSVIEASGLGYAYEQLNFDAEYAITNVSNAAYFNTGLLGTTVTRSFLISGNLPNSTDFATFGGEIDYYDVTTSTPLGSVTFGTTVTGVGPFSQTVTGSGLVVGINGPDVLQLTGSFFLIADPASVSVQSVPEPSTLALLGAGALSLVGYGWRRRRAR
jgi:hypothetical protein